MDAQGLTSKLKSLSPQQHQTFFALYHNPDAIDRIKKQLLQDFQEQKDNTSNRYPHKFQDPQALVKLSAIYLSNMLKLGYSREFGTGVFPLYSRINFSCVPNLQAHYNSATQKLVVHAVRHINKGEELLTRFHAKACRTREQRNAMFKVRGFKCRCKACVGKEAYASNERRKAMLHLDIGLEAYDKSTEARLAVSVPRGANEALEMALELLELFRQEGILDCELQSV